MTSAFPNKDINDRGTKRVFHFASIEEIDSGIVSTYTPSSEQTTLTYTSPNHTAHRSAHPSTVDPNSTSRNQTSPCPTCGSPRCAAHTTTSPASPDSPPHPRPDSSLYPFQNPTRSANRGIIPATNGVERAWMIGVVASGGLGSMRLWCGGMSMSLGRALRRRLDSFRAWV
ncbi:hypothetical protein V565_012680 [Rhizoctonia solani 123E]|uniref:Uncharacterized protein n=1 Tax=Rhizoctonia solani 123E TaxID=1423351 RepID=A0A074SYA7_9AGAM|nr:hypothetical protein V565_012680 [Rhizoctonia solani 123E]